MATMLHTSSIVAHNVVFTVSSCVTLVLCSLSAHVWPLCRVHCRFCRVHCQPTCNPCVMFTARPCVIPVTCLLSDNVWPYIVFTVSPCMTPMLCSLSAHVWTLCCFHCQPTCDPCVVFTTISPHVTSASYSQLVSPVLCSQLKQILTCNLMTCVSSWNDLFYRLAVQWQESVLGRKGLNGDLRICLLCGNCMNWVSSTERLHVVCKFSAGELDPSLL